MRISAIQAAVLGTMLVVGAGTAHAFQIIAPDTNPDGSTKFTDPDQMRTRFSDQSQTGSNSKSLKFGNSTLQFSGGNSSNAPTPFMRDQFLDNPASRTVPSQNR